METEAPKSKIMFGMALGETVAAKTDEGDSSSGSLTRRVAKHAKVRLDVPCTLRQVMLLNRNAIIAPF